MKTYNVSLSIEGIKEIEDIFDKAQKLISNDKFYKHIAENCKSLLEDICKRVMVTIDDTDLDASAYMSGNNLEIEGDTIYLFNNSRIDTSTKNMTPEKRKNYPLQLSLAKIVEYGIGIVGAQTAVDTPEDWQYDVNDHGEEGWYYFDNAGNRWFTKGFEGRLIFLRLKYQIEDNIKDWIIKYMKDNI